MDTGGVAGLNLDFLMGFDIAVKQHLFRLILLHFGVLFLLVVDSYYYII